MTSSASGPVLESIGSRVYHLGATGTGAVMKLAVNSVIFAIGQAISESLVLAERAGIERERAYEIFENSAVAAPMVKYRRDQYLHPESAAVAFAMSLALKDLVLIHDLAESSGTADATGGRPSGDVPTCHRRGLRRRRHGGCREIPSDASHLSGRWHLLRP